MVRCIFNILLMLKSLIIFGSIFILIAVAAILHQGSKSVASDGTSISMSLGNNARNQSIVSSRSEIKIEEEPARTVFADESNEAARSAKIKSKPSWPETETRFQRMASLKYAKFLNTLPEDIRDEVHALILDINVPRPRAEAVQLDLKLQEKLGNERYAQYEATYLEIRQRVIDNEISSLYAKARPDASTEEISAVGAVLAQIDLLKETNALLKMPAGITNQQIVSLMNAYDASFATAAQANPSIDPQALAALKKIFDRDIKDDLRKKLEWKRDNPVH